MAVADDKGSGMTFETVEARRLFAFNPVGAPGVLLATGAVAVESAAAAPDAANNTRYATVLNDTGVLTVVPVQGNTSATPGNAITVPTAMGSAISNTDVATNTANGTPFVVVYQQTVTTPPGPGNPGGADADVYAALFANGAIVGTPVRVNTTTNGNQTDCRVSMDGAGNFVVVWQSSTGARVVGRRFNADGSANGGEFTIAATGLEPDVSANGGGAFAVTWSTANQTFAQLYSANGQANGSPISVTGEGFTEPAIGLANNGRFVIAWATSAGNGRRVVAQRYALGGAALGGPFNAATVTTQNQTAPQVAVDQASNFAIGWAQATAGTNYDQAAFRVFRNTGVAFDAETVITGVRFGADNRFGLAYRVNGLVHVAYATPAGEALMQTYLNDTAVTDAERPVPGGALLLDLTNATPGSRLDVQEVGNQLRVTTNGVLATYTRSNYSSIYVRGNAGADYIRLFANVTLPAIIYARDGADTVYGGSANDQIDGGGGGMQLDEDGFPLRDANGQIIVLGNAIQARDGNDYVYGGDSNDTVFGGGGDDRLLGGPGRNVVYGEDGDDTLLGGNRADALFGAAGADVLDGGDGGDNLDGGQGNDSLDGSDGDDRLFGNNGNDQLEGGLGDDILHGGRGDDRLFGNDGRDSLFGDANADLLRGGGVNGVVFNPFDKRTYDIYYFDRVDILQGVAVKIDVI